ncbi:MAG TPA: glycosyltransferase WbuB, partial [Alphaproteobacteria bacterium]|nr:glycosyltransferase WbuB [Alphaproteobacteria bacterium]
FAAQDKDAFAGAILRLCADPSLRRRIAGGAQAAIETQGLSWARNAARVVELAQPATGSVGR